MEDILDVLQRWAVYGLKEDEKSKMLLMSKLSFEKTTQVRYTRRAKQALEQAVLDLNKSGRVQFDNDDVTQEALVNATWLWLEEMGSARVEEAMLRIMPQLEELLRSRAASETKKGPSDQGGAKTDDLMDHVKVTDLTPRAARPKRRKKGTGA